MNDKELFNQKEFPVWEDYNTSIEETNEIEDWYDNDTDLMVKNICELMSFNKYYKDMLLYIQRKIYLGEPLELCLNSAKEVFGIMITPCEILNDKGEELTLEDYDELSEYVLIHFQERIHYACKVCSFKSFNIFDNFNQHKCEDYTIRNDEEDYMLFDEYYGSCEEYTLNENYKLGEE